jgi:hypothetical protein
VPIELHHFLKVIEEDEMVIDILIAATEEVRTIIQDAAEAESEEGRIKIAFNTVIPKDDFKTVFRPIF